MIRATNTFLGLETSKRMRTSDKGNKRVHVTAGARRVGGVITLVLAVLALKLGVTSVERVPRGGGVSDSNNAATCSLVSIAHQSGNDHEALKHMGRAVQSWQALPEVQEIFLLGSRDVWENVLRRSRIARQKITIIDTQHNGWRVARILNLGAWLAKGSHILHLDPLDELESRFFHVHPLLEDRFYAGNAAHANRSVAQAFIFSRRQWHAAGGFDECLHIPTLSADELGHRLSKQNIKRFVIQNSFVTSQAAPFAQVQRATDAVWLMSDSNSCLAAAEHAHILGFVCNFFWHTSCKSAQQALFDHEKSRYDSIVGLLQRSLEMHTNIPKDSIQNITDLQSLSSLYFMHTSLRSRVLLAHARFSLAERMLAVALTKSIADLNNMVPVVIWTADGLVNCTMDDIFESSILTLHVCDSKLLLGLSLPTVDLLDVQNRLLSGPSMLKLPFGANFQLTHDIMQAATNVLHSLTLRAAVVDQMQALAAEMPQEWAVLYIQCKEHILTDMTQDLEVNLHDVRSQACQPAAYFNQVAKLNVPGFVVFCDSLIPKSLSQDRLGSHKFLKMTATLTPIGCAKHAAQLVAMSQRPFIGSHYSPATLLVEMFRSEQQGQSVPVPMPSGQCHAGFLNVVVQYPFLHQDLIVRQVEYIVTLSRSLAHPSVKKVYVLIQHSDHASELKSYQLYDPCAKLTVKCCYESVKYSTLFEFVSINILNEIAVVMQSDIYLGDGFSAENMNKLNSSTVMALTRYEKRPGPLAEGGCGYPSLCPLYKNAIGGYLSTDSWVMRLKAPITTSQLRLLDFAPNLFGAENLLIHMLKRFGFYVSNPCKSLITYHNHCSQLRSQSLSVDTVAKRADLEVCGTWHCTDTNYSNSDGYVNEGPTYIR